VQRGETLWGIASAMRPDSRLSMNQTMLAIFEANPQAFQGNINILSAGATLQIPSADDIYRIDRRDALSEVIRQHSAWGGVVPTTSSQPTISDVVDTRPSLTLVPPDEDPIGLGTGEDLGTGDEPVTREQEIMDRIIDLQAAEVPVQQSLIEIRDNELAALRAELAEIRGEVYEPPLTDIVADEAAEDGITDAELQGDDAIADDAADDEITIDASQGSSSVLIDTSPSFVDLALGWLTSIWAIIAGAVIAVAGLLFWFVRRDRDDDDDAAAWDALDADEIRIDPLDPTETIQAPQYDDSIVVVEQDAPESPLDGDTPGAAAVDDTAGDSSSDVTGQFGSLEDTFSSETAVNLDQSDPVAEADFHMAYGLYDQAADLINGALQIEPERQDLLTKLCEIYFVWGNQDSFIDAAQRLNSAVGGGESADWDKIVIMGQQIAADHELFAGAAVAGATKEVDLSFEDESEGTGALDMDFGADGGADDDIIDLGAVGDDEAVDFMLADGSSGEATAETPTIEEQFAGLDNTSELPNIDETSLDKAIEESGLASDETAEIDLADLDLGNDGLAETELASLDDLDVTGTNEVLDVVIDVTGRNPQVDPDATGVQSALDPNATGMSEVLNMEDELSSTPEMRLANDETGQSPMVDALGSDATDLSNLLDATGHTQILSENMAVESLSDEAGDLADADATVFASTLGEDDEATALASLDDDPGEGDFDFAKTEALEPDVYTGGSSLDETGELPVVASTDVDLDLDDLTDALKVSEMGDTVEQHRDDATVEQPRPPIEEDDEVATMRLAEGDMSEDLQEARTMTEVGTKLDLARAYVDMGDPAGARGILEEVLDEGDDSQRQQAQALLDSLPS
jgi:pilus assembly protein FimV